MKADLWILSSPITEEGAPIVIYDEEVARDAVGKGQLVTGYFRYSRVTQFMEGNWPFTTLPEGLTQKDVETLEIALTMNSYSTEHMEELEDLQRRIKRWIGDKE